MAVLKKGTELTCPKCEKVMCIVNRDIASGTMLKGSMFTPVKGKVRNELPMECPFDSEPFGKYSKRGTRLHTKTGWIP